MKKINLYPIECAKLIKKRQQMEESCQLMFVRLENLQASAKPGSVAATIGVERCREILAGARMELDEVTEELHRHCLRSKPWRGSNPIAP